MAAAGPANARATRTYVRGWFGRPPAPRASAAVCLAIFGLFVFGTYTYAQQADPRQGDTAVLLGGAGEFYLAALPPGWHKRGEAADALGHHGDWLPEGQSLEDWTDRMTLQVVPGLAGEPPPDFLDRMANLRAESCVNMFATEVESAPVNGFPVGFRIIACTRDKRTDMGDVKLVRVVSGEQALYVIQRTFRVAPFAPPSFPLDGDALEAARAALEYGFACRRASARRPCPADWRPVLDSLADGRALVVYPAAP